MSDETYIDSDGNRRGLDAMCRHEPEWAANIIRTLRSKCASQQDELSALDDDIDTNGGPRTPMAGESAVMLCPFHKEKTPSLLVKGGRYRCLGCGASGDVTGFDIRLAPPKSGSVG